LAVLCQCDGRAVRRNQARIARIFLQEAPELLLTLRLEEQPAGTPDLVYIRGDPAYFVEFAQTAEYDALSAHGRATIPGYSPPSMVRAMA
jgi:hypothetical protein